VNALILPKLQLGVKVHAPYSGTVSTVYPECNNPKTNETTAWPKTRKPLKRFLKSKILL